MKREEDPRGGIGWDPDVPVLREQQKNDTYHCRVTSYQSLSVDPPPYNFRLTLVEYRGWRRVVMWLSRKLYGLAKAFRHLATRNVQG
jgi:hypothetical protein